MRRRPRTQRTKKKKSSEEIECTYTGWSGEEVILYKSTLKGHILPYHPDFIDYMPYLEDAFANPTSVVKDKHEEGSVWVNYYVEEKGDYIALLIAEDGDKKFIKTGFNIEDPKEGEKVWPEN